MNWSAASLNSAAAGLSLGCSICQVALRAAATDLEGGTPANIHQGALETCCSHLGCSSDICMANSCMLDAEGISRISGRPQLGCARGGKPSVILLMHQYFIPAGVWQLCAVATRQLPTAAGQPFAGEPGA